MNLQEFWSELISKTTLAGAVFGIIISISVWLFSKLLTCISNWYKYSKYTGNYQSFLKTDLTSHQFDITLKRQGNKFKVSGKSIISKPKIELISGLIEMSKSIKNYGRGYYSHEVRENDTVQKFGFYEIQLMDGKDLKIFVHQNIKGAGKEDSAAYVWEKV